MADNKKEIPNQRKIRAFASFQNEAHQKLIFNELLNVIPKKHQFTLGLYLGMMDSTIAEGYSDDNK
tara:strand:- start:1495 stop:1692 length:198 start_codon:yes stop_codon:yes gene_type:complete